MALPTPSPEWSCKNAEAGHLARLRVQERKAYFSASSFTSKAFSSGKRNSLV
jgi:hypothetical protein